MSHPGHCVFVALAVLVWAAAAFVCAGAPATGSHLRPALPAIRRSDVVFMLQGDPEQYRQYGATVVGWGAFWYGFVAQEEQALQSYRLQVDQAHALGLRFYGHHCFQTRYRDFIDWEPNFLDSVCRGLDGEALTIPWMKDQPYGAHPPYWFCTNSPRYRQFLRRTVELVAQAGIDGLQIDGPMGTAQAEWLGSCFCRHCVAAFRDYLRAHASAEELSALGVQELDAFDYAEFLRGRGITREQFKRMSWDRHDLPLAHHYMSFQYSRAVELVEEMHAYAEEVAGRPLALGVNSVLEDARWLTFAPVVTHFCCEVRHHASDQEVPAGPIFAYKLGDALGRPIACTAWGEDWAYVMSRKMKGLVRAWIAQSCAFGHNFMAPTNQWSYSDEQGTQWYQSQAGDFDYLYRFVREHAALLDGYDAVARVGLLYSNAAFWQRQQAAKDICTELALENVPFRLVVAGDKWLPDRLTAEDLEGLQALVVTEPACLDDAQRAALDAARERVITWPDRHRLSELVAPQIRVQGAENVTAVARTRPGDDAAPFVCHLLNRNYRPDADAMSIQRDFKVVLAPSLLGADVRRAVLHALGKEPAEVSVRPTQDGPEIAVPELDLWAILELARN